MATKPRAPRGKGAATKTETPPKTEAAVEKVAEQSESALSAVTERIQAELAHQRWMREWQPELDDESGLPLQMLTPGGKVLPLMVMPRNKKVKDARGNWTWERTYGNYLQVAHRLVWFREENPDHSIETEFTTVDLERGFCICRATIRRPVELKANNIVERDGVEMVVVATATKQETKKDFGDYLEKAETGAVGRALALCGYGTQFAPEFDEGDRLADSPMPPNQKAEVPPDYDGPAGQGGAADPQDHGGRAEQQKLADDRAQQDRDAEREADTMLNDGPTQTGGKDGPVAKALWEALVGLASKYDLVEGDKVWITGTDAKGAGLQDGTYGQRDLTSKQAQYLCGKLATRKPK